MENKCGVSAVSLEPEIKNSEYTHWISAWD